MEAACPNKGTPQPWSIVRQSQKIVPPPTSAPVKHTKNLMWGIYVLHPRGRQHDTYISPGGGFHIWEKGLPGWILQQRPALQKSNDAWGPMDKHFRFFSEASLLMGNYPETWNKWGTHNISIWNEVDNHIKPASSCWPGLLEPTLPPWSNCLWIVLFLD